MRPAAQRVGIPRQAVIGLVVLMGGLLLWIVAFTGGLSKLFSSPTKTVRARFTSIEDIVPNDPVRIDGVQVGTVSDVTRDRDGRGATLTMSIDTSDPIYRNARASILWRTALGAVDAVSIDPGSRSAGLLGDATIPQSRDSNQVELDEITGALHGAAQQGMRTMLQQLGPALASHPALARDLSTAAAIAPAATVGIGALRGEIRDTDLNNLVRQAGQAARALTVGSDGAETRQLVQSAAVTLDSVGNDPAQLRAAIATLDRVYVQGDRYVFRQYDALLSHVDPLVAQLNDAVGLVAPTLSALHPALVNTHKLLSDAHPLLHELSPAVTRLAHAATVGVPLIDQLKPGLDDLAKTVLPGLAQRYPEEGGRAVYEEIGPVAVTLGAVSAFFDRNGAYENLTGALQDTQQESLPCTEDFSGKDFLVCATLSEALQEFMSGGTQLLQNLIRRPYGQRIYGNLLNEAERVQGQLNTTERTLRKKFPLTAKYLLSPNHGEPK